MRKKILTAAFLCAFVGTRAQEFYEKHVAFPAGAATEQKIDMASRLVPTPQQLGTVRRTLLSSTLRNWTVNNGYAL